MPGAVPPEDLPSNIVPTSDLTAPPVAKPKEGGIVPQWIKSAVLPTVGGVGGGMAGGLISSPSILGVPAGVIGGEMGGSALGEQINQWLGITEPSKMAVAGSALSAPLGRGLGALGRGTFDAVVKTMAGRDIMSEAASGLLSKWLSPKVSSKALFEEAGQLEMSVPATKTIEAIDGLLKAESERAPTEIKKQIIDMVKPLRNYFLKAEPMAERAAAPEAPLTKVVMGKSGVRGMEAPVTQAATQATEQPARRSLTGKLMSAPELMEESQRLRAIASKAFDDGDTKLGLAVDNIRSAMLKDLEDSGAGVVKEAATAYRKEMALESLGKLLGKPHPVQKIADYTKDNPLFKGAFNDQERAQINRIAKVMAHIPESGGTGVIGRGLTTLAGEHLGGMAGGVAGYFGPDVVRSIMRSPFGRNVAERIIGNRITLDHPTAAALAMFGKGMIAHSPREATNENAGQDQAGR